MISSALPNETVKTVVLVGAPADDGIQIKIQSLGYRYARRILTSGPNNWLSIASQLRQLRQAGRLAAVIMLWTEDNIDRCLLPEHGPTWSKLLNELVDVPTIAFIYEEVFDHITDVTPSIVLRDDFVSRTFREKHGMVQVEYPAGMFVRHHLAADHRAQWEECAGSVRVLTFYPGGGEVQIPEERFPRVKALLEEILTERNRLAQEFIDAMGEAQVEVVPYRTRIDRVVRTEHFLDATVTGEFLRLYVPFGRYQSEQLASFLRLFENYTRRIEGWSLRIDTHRTEHGTVYTFRSLEGMAGIQGIEEAVTRFESLLGLYDSNPEDAQNLLTSMGLDANEARQLLSRYERDYRRLVLDMKHEYESKILALRHTLENHALELSGSKELPPTLVGVEDLTSVAESLLAPTSLTYGETARGIVQVEELLNGSITYSLDDHELMDLFEKYESGIKSIQLKSHLDQLKDATLPNHLRAIARQEIVGFLYKMMPKLGQSVMMDYIQYLNALSDAPSV